MVIWVMHTQELYEPFIVSCFFNEKKLGRDSEWRFLLGKKTLNNLRLPDGAPGSGGISFQLELAGVMKLANQYPNCFYPIDKSIYNAIL